MGGNSTDKLPVGLHRYYLSDHFTNALFWFMMSSIYVHGMSFKEAAVAFQEFMKLDNSQASVNAIQYKFRRQQKLFKGVMMTDRGLINLNDDELKSKIKNGIQSRISRENMRTSRAR